MQLPIVARRSLMKTWKYGDLGIEILEFEMDPSQDLLVLIESPELCVLSFF